MRAHRNGARGQSLDFAQAAVAARPRPAAARTLVQLLRDSRHGESAGTGLQLCRCAPPTAPRLTLSVSAKRAPRRKRGEKIIKRRCTARIRPHTPIKHGPPPAAPDFRVSSVRIPPFLVLNRPLHVLQRFRRRIPSILARNSRRKKLKSPHGESGTAMRRERTRSTAREAWKRERALGRAKEGRGRRANDEPTSCFFRAVNVVFCSTIHPILPVEFASGGRGVCRDSAGDSALFRTHALRLRAKALGAASGRGIGLRLGEA